MATRLEVYECKMCGNIVEVLRGGDGELVCCGKPMVKLEARTKDQGMEKHVPVIEKVDGGIKVKVGSVAHPMEADHYIEWIEVLVDGRSYVAYLSPGQAPEAVFQVSGGKVTAREHCNKHGLWQGE
ncbi:MAG TPA: desulfoferrodoxin [Phycisphaerales bacterium]|nr:desulfoferrodoxin [Phycisphaerales bacterium]